MSEKSVKVCLLFCLQRLIILNNFEVQIFWNSTKKIGKLCLLLGSLRLFDNFFINFSLAFSRKIWVHKLKQLINAANFSVPASIFLVKMTPVNELELNEKSLFTNDTKTKEEPLNHGCCRSKHTKGCCIATGVFGGLFLGEFSHDFWRKKLAIFVYIQFDD